MTVVNPKSISGINSITTGSGSDNLLTIHTSDANNTERLRIDSTGVTKIVTGIVTTLTATTGIVTTLTANTVTSLGAVSGTTGTFSGAVSGTTGTFSGAVSGTTGTFTSHVSLGDNDQLRIGDGDDLQIYHDASNTVLVNNTGDLYIQNDSSNDTNKILIRPKAGEASIECAPNGSVSLFHDDVNKFSTQSYGAAIDGVLALVKDSADDETSGFQVNGAAMDSSGFNYIMSATNDTANCLTVFVNGSGRSTDGGTNGLTIRNDSGPMAVGNGTQINTFHTGNGGGISFAATAGPTNGTASNEILDDYEEGSFTVGLLNSSPQTVGGTGTYVKIGRMVKAWVYLSFSGTPPNNTNGWVLTGFPYATDGSHHGFGGITYTGAANYDVWRPLMQSSTTNVYFHRVDGNSGTLLNNYVVSNPISTIIFGVIYDTAA